MTTKRCRARPQRGKRPHIAVPLSALLVGIVTLLPAAVPAATAAVKARPVRGMVIDPADYLAKIPDAAVFARTLVDQLADNAVNTLYLNAYNVQYGAYYRTGYKYNTQSSYGKQDLLGRLIPAAHARGIKVVAALYDHQHRGAWEAKSSWRAKTKNQGDYNPPRTDIQFYLSVGHPDAVSWWMGFLRDLLDRYPDLDGVELREPIINWWGTQADWNPKVTEAFRAEHPTATLGGRAWRAFRADTLTDFLQDETKLIQSREMFVHVTSVGSVHSNGTLMTPKQVADETGFDLDGILAKKNARPEAVKVEIIWQQWGRLWGFVTFTPAWTRTATRVFLDQVDGRTDVIVHVELTQFGSHRMTADEVREMLAAADQRGVAGLDIYSARLADERGFWPLIREAYGAAGVPKAPTFEGERALILYDGSDAPGMPADVSRMNATNLANLLGHLDVPWRVASVEQYERGDAENYSAIFYLGTVYGNATQRFVSDASVYDRTLVWIGQNLFELAGNDPDFPFTQASQKPSRSYVRLRYGAHAMTAAGDVIPTKARGGAKVLARLERKDGKVTAYALRAGALWYFAGSPFTAIDREVVNGRYLVFADLLHTILGKEHTAERQALIRIDGITPLSDPDALAAQTAVLEEAKIPYALSVTPIWTDGQRTIELADRPALAKALRGMTARGASIVLNGAQHSYDGTTGSEPEFWDEDAGEGVQEDGTEYVSARVDAGLTALWRAGLHALRWHMPFDVATQFDYTAIGEYFTTFVERRSYGTIEGVAFRQPMPFTVEQDVYGARIVPENLGVARTAEDVRRLVANAEALRAVRDGLAGAALTTAVPPASVASLAEQVAALGYRFIDLAAVQSVVTGTTRVEISGTGTVDLAVPSGTSVMEMRVARSGRVLSRSTLTYLSYTRIQRTVTVAPGSVFVLAHTQAVAAVTPVRPILARVAWWIVVSILAMASMAILWLGVLSRSVRRQTREAHP